MPKTNPYKNLKEGAFTAQARKAGMSVNKYADYVITNYRYKNSKSTTSKKKLRRGGVVCFYFF